MAGARCTILAAIKAAKLDWRDPDLLAFVGIDSKTNETALKRLFGRRLIFHAFEPNWLRWKFGHATLASRIVIVRA
jgi:hypothetical protein